MIQNQTQLQQQFQNVQFAATYPFTIDIEKDVKSAKLEAIENLRVKPLLLEISEDDIYEKATSHDEEESLFDDLDMHFDVSPQHKVSAFLSSDNTLTVKTPDAGEDDLAREAGLLRFLLNKMGVKNEKIDDFMVQVLNGSLHSKQKALEVKVSIQDRPQEREIPQQFDTSTELVESPVSPEFDVVKPEVTMPEDLRRQERHYLRNEIINLMENTIEEDYIVTIITDHPNANTLDADHRYALIEKAAGKNWLKVIHTLRKMNTPINNPYRHSEDSVHKTAVSHNYVGILEYLLQQGYTLDKNNLDGQALLKLAVQKGHVESVQFLYENGMSLNEQDDSGLSLMYEAVVNGHLKVVQFLVDEGVPLRARDSDDGAMLMIRAAQSGDLELVKFLRSKELTLTMKTGDGNSPLLTAARHNKSNITSYFVNTEGKSWGYYDYLEHTNNENQNVFHMAARGNSLQVFQQLRTFLTRKSCNSKDVRGNTPAHYLVDEVIRDWYGNAYVARDCMKLLLENKASFDVENNAGESVWDMVPGKTFKKRALKKTLGI